MEIDTQIKHLKDIWRTGISQVKLAETALAELGQPVPVSAIRDRKERRIAKIERNLRQNSELIEVVVDMPEWKMAVLGKDEQ